MLIKTTLHIIICFCFQQDPWLHHYGSGSAGPSLSPEIARSARPLPVRIDNSIDNIKSLSLLTFTSPKSDIQNREETIC